MKTTEYLKGTALETIESESQQDQLYSGLPNAAQEGRKRRGAIAVFDIMTSLQ